TGACILGTQSKRRPRVTRIWGEFGRLLAKTQGQASLLSPDQPSSALPSRGLTSHRVPREETRVEDGEPELTGRSAGPGGAERLLRALTSPRGESSSTPSSAVFRAMPPASREWRGFRQVPKLVMSQPCLEPWLSSPGMPLSLSPPAPGPTLVSQALCRWVSHAPASQATSTLPACSHISPLLWLCSYQSH
uniref:Uncharacterized protein n=1 Tax=Mustela putorius furo TaxID=9669 RepID=M3YA84_MUSPF